MNAPTALLAVRGQVDGVRTWVSGGLVPAWVVPAASWTLIVPAGPPATAAPYDDPVTMLGGRPVPGRLRPALMLVADGNRAVITVQVAGRAARRRWLVWSRGVGMADVADLPRAPLGLLAHLAGGGDQRGSGPAPGAVGRRDALRAALAGDERTGARVVDDLLGALGLPGAGIVAGQVEVRALPGVLRVEPDRDVVARFDAVARQESEGVRPGGAR
jgi:hypothetical protein